LFEKLFVVDFRELKKSRELNKLPFCTYSTKYDFTHFCVLPRLAIKYRGRGEGEFICYDMIMQGTRCWDMDDEEEKENIDVHRNPTVEEVD
jgi:hypothetical protein